MEPVLGSICRVLGKKKQHISPRMQWPATVKAFEHRDDHLWSLPLRPRPSMITTNSWAACGWFAKSCTTKRMVEALWLHNGINHLSTGDSDFATIHSMVNSPDSDWLNQQKPWVQHSSTMFDHQTSGFDYWTLGFYQPKAGRLHQWQVNHFLGNVLLSSSFLCGIIMPPGQWLTSVPNRSAP